MSSRWYTGLGLAVGLSLSGWVSSLSLEGSGERSSEPVASAALAVEPAPAEPARLPRARTERSKASDREAFFRAAAEALPLEDDDDEPDLDEQFRQQLRDAVTQARREPREAVWASAMEASLRSALDQTLSWASVAVGEPDCRTERCLVPLEWPDREAAVEHGEKLILELPEHCERIMTFLDDEQDELETYRSTVVLHCPPPGAQAQR
jgi:hypothetical protein